MQTGVTSLGLERVMWSLDGVDLLMDGLDILAI